MDITYANWLEVRDALNQIPAEELRAQPIVILGENTHQRDCTVVQFAEDKYQGEYCIGSASEIADDFKAEGKQPVYRKGQFVIDPDTGLARISQ